MEQHKDFVQDCYNCQSTGQHRYVTHVENGIPQGRILGVCYRCQGKGWQSTADIKRNEYYDNQKRRV